MKTTATYSHTNRELHLQVEDKRMTFDVIALPFKDVFEYEGEIYDIHFLIDSSLWIGENGIMQECDIEVER